LNYQQRRVFSVKYSALRLTFALITISAMVLLPFRVSSLEAQTIEGRELRPDTARALGSRASEAIVERRKNGYTPLRRNGVLEMRPTLESVQSEDANSSLRAPARAASINRESSTSLPESPVSEFIRSGTSLGRVLHTSQLSIITTDGSIEQYVDTNGNLIADERATFDRRGGAFDIAVGRSGTRYEVYSAIDDNGTSRTDDDLQTGVIILAFDTNGDFVRDSSQTFNLRRDFGFRSVASVVAGTSRAGREFVVVSSSGYYNSANLNDPNNEPSAGVVVLVRDSLTGGFDVSRTREIVRAGDNQLNNANALALLPSGDLLIADFDSNEIRIARDTNDDLIPDTLDRTPYYSFQYSNDAPLDIAANSRGVVFSHSFGNDAVMLALYDTNNDRRADREEVVVTGLSLDNNLFFHGLTVDREGTVYVIEDASGAADEARFGGNLGLPRIDAFPDPALNGFLRDGALFAVADNEFSQALSGLAFGVDPAMSAVNRLALVNSASLRAPATRDGLASITGTGLTNGAQGATETQAQAANLRVTIEGRAARIFSFNNNQINIHVPNEIGRGIRSVVVSRNGVVLAADDVEIADANPGLFTVSQTGAGEAIGLLASGTRYTAAPFPVSFDGQASVIALFGTGWRNSLPVTVTIGGRSAIVEYAGASGGFPGLDQINVRVPQGTGLGAFSVIVTTANGATSRADVQMSFR
jgi:uncharacterized protein (TIGR03437 family)